MEKSRGNVFFLLLVKNTLFPHFWGKYAHVAKLVDALSSGGSAFGCEGSNPFVRTYLFFKEFPLKYFEKILLLFMNGKIITQKISIRSKCGNPI